MNKRFDDSGGRSTRLLASAERAPAIVANPGARSPFLLLGDHAGRAIPARLGDLGLEGNDLTRHIAWDIGVAELGLRLSERLDATFVSQRYSRLVIDCNRDPKRADSIPAMSDGTTVHGNVGLSPAARTARAAEIFQPYHDAVAAILDERITAGIDTVVVALHSFTPTLQGDARPWRFGVLHLGDSTFSEALLSALRVEIDVAEVGDNAPYRMDQTDFTVPHHAVARGLPYAEVEVRQDLVMDEAGQLDVASRLARVLLTAHAATSN